jgi:hypothetical protein
MLRVLQHLAARFGAFSALLGAGGHMFVVGEFFAGGSALVAAFRAALTGMEGEGAGSARERRGKFATLSAVQAGLYGFGVLFFAFGQQLHAVAVTGFALQLASGADFGTLQEMFGMLPMFIRTGRGGGRKQAESTEHQTNHQNHFHDRTP